MPGGSPGAARKLVPSRANILISMPEKKLNKKYFFIFTKTIFENFEILEILKIFENFGIFPTFGRFSEHITVGKICVCE